MEVDGLKVLQKQLSQLGPKTGGNALRTSARNAMRRALLRAEAAAPRRQDTAPKKTYKGRIVGPGFASRNIRIKARLSRDRRTVSVLLGPIREAFYATQFVEVGKSKTHQQPPRPWLEPAFDASQRSVIDEFADQLRKRITAAVKRLNR